MRVIEPHFLKLIKGNESKLLCVIGFLGLISGTLLHYQFGNWYKIGNGHSFGPDETFITYRYAQNLANGFGLTWNPGERVEGYSAILHVFIAALGAKLTPNHIFEFCIVFNLIFVLFICYLYLKKISLDFGSKNNWFPFLFIMFSPYLWLWTASGFESVLVAGLTFLLWYYSDKVLEIGDSVSVNKLYLVSISVILMHVDGFVNPLIASIYLYSRGSKRNSIKIALITAITVLAQVSFRLYYYGFPLNNPYYLKIDGAIMDRLVSGVATLREITWEQSWWTIFVGLGASSFYWLWAGIKRRSFFEFEFYELFFVLWIGYFLFIGGDYLYERMLLSFVFFAAFPIVRGLRSYSRVTSNIVCGLILMINLSVLFTDARFAYRIDKRDKLKELGVFLGRHHPNDTLAVEAAGKIPFFSKLNTIDMLGYNNTRIAHSKTHEFKIGHSKYDADYVLNLKPDLIATLVNPDLNGFWGLDKKLYLAYGYKPYLLVFDGDPNGFKLDSLIKNVEKIREEELPDLIKQGWNYMVLKRG